ncbi:MAG: hypothetical protein D6814_02855 [Calditrichaeota bacterium]|nr:MAG: hypothetical protein D6814_02855 [Calditrichota bacterium]
MKNLINKKNESLYPSKAAFDFKRSIKLAQWYRQKEKINDEDFNDIAKFIIAAYVGNILETKIDKSLEKAFEVIPNWGAGLGEKEK